ncbi:unnamed protein product [Strongylus vulgaris]|uniref:Uncharacterized protein n=1 Tax=Strongylus vulgaris TaxID=40348 RepID=A0A3P7IIJ8_STRVU|nr:unnamed protein product [Strongylus vulgaris]
MFAYLYYIRQDSSSAKEIRVFLESEECKKAVSDEIPNPTTLSHLRDFSVLDHKGFATPAELEALPINRLILHTQYLLQLHNCDDAYQGLLQAAIFELSRRFIQLKAFAPCLSLLEKSFGSEVIIEKCKVLIAKGDESTAEHLLRSLLQTTVTVEPEIEIEARCLLAELFAGPRNLLDQAVAFLQEALDRFDKSIIKSESRLRYFSLIHRLTARQLYNIEEHLESRAFRMREDAIREWSKQQEQASQRPPSMAARRIECELRCEKEAVETVKKKLLSTAVATVSAGLEALKLLSEPYKKQPLQPKHINDAVLRHIFPLIDVIFRFDDNVDVVRELKMYVGSGMVPAVWVQVIITKLIMAYPYHVLHSVLLYKFDENRAPVVQSMLEEAERRIANEKDRARLHEIIEDMTAAHVAYLQFVALKMNDTRFFEKRGNSALYYMLGNVSIMSRIEILKRVPLPVVEQKLGFPRDYSGDELVKWEVIERECMQADGLSAPKITRIYIVVHTHDFL